MTPPPGAEPKKIDPRALVTTSEFCRAICVRILNSFVYGAHKSRADNDQVPCVSIQRPRHPEAEYVSRSGSPRGGGRKMLADGTT
jgi:hypothetical protein